MRHNLKYPVELKMRNKTDGTMYPLQHFISRANTFISFVDVLVKQMFSVRDLKHSPAPKGVSPFQKNQISKQAGL